MLILIYVYVCTVEKETDSKLDLLLKKNLYPTAITLAAEETRWSTYIYSHEYIDRYKCMYTHVRMRVIYVRTFRCVCVYVCIRLCMCTNCCYSFVYSVTGERSLDFIVCTVTSFMAEVRFQHMYTFIHGSYHVCNHITYICTHVFVYTEYRWLRYVRWAIH